MKTVIYQVLTRLWGEGRFSSFDRSVLTGLKASGVDCIWFTGIPRHASGKDFVKGDPGCPYAVTDWYDVNPYLADDPASRLEEFRALVGRCHDVGLTVCMDYIPNHVARDYSGRLPHHDWCDADWTDTLKVDWSAPETVGEMSSILLYWCSFGVDAFRCDMVELVPSALLGEVIANVKGQYPATKFIAEVYGLDNYGRYIDEAGFDLLYDKSGVYDILRAVRTSSMSAENLTWNWQRLGDRQPAMLNFLENHDEQRVTWWAGDPYWAGTAFSMLYNTASYMLYFGEEIGELAPEGAEGRTSIFDMKRSKSLAKLQALYSGDGRLTSREKAVFKRFSSLLKLAHEKAFKAGEVWDLCYLQDACCGFDRQRQFAFMRYLPDGEEVYVVFCNFSDAAATVELQFPDELAHICPKKKLRMSAAAMDFSAVRLQ